MQIIKETIEIDEYLENKVNNALMFSKCKSKLEHGYYIDIPKSNITYIEPHKLLMGDITFLFFNCNSQVYVNTLETEISFTEFKEIIKRL